jgi:hypothetical protein
MSLETWSTSKDLLDNRLLKAENEIVVFGELLA